LPLLLFLFALLVREWGMNFVFRIWICLVLWRKISSFCDCALIHIAMWVCQIWIRSSCSAPVLVQRGRCAPKFHVFSLYFFAPREPSALVARERCLPRWFFSPSSSPVSCSPCGSRHRFSIRGASWSLAAAHSQGPAASSCLSIHFSVPRSVLRCVCCLWFGLCYCRLIFLSVRRSWRIAIHGAPSLCRQASILHMKFSFPVNAYQR
jgi:hypothetical protein